MSSFVAIRDKLSRADADRIINGMSFAALTQLEMETNERSTPAFTADYDPYART